MTQTKFFYIQTLGCRLNQAESQELKQALLDQGWQETDQPKQADLVVLNTCVVTKKAERETRKAVRSLRQDNPDAELVVAGCWVDKMKQFGGIDVEGIDRRIGNEEKWNGLNYELNNVDYFSKRALVRVQSGCSNACAYCLPYLIRGQSQSVPIKQIVKKVKQALKRGAIEVVLTGQNVSQYQDENKNWLDLVERVLKETDVPLLRLGSINPLLVEVGDRGSKQAAEQLVEIYQGVGKDRLGSPIGGLARHLHLSLQSGSNKILKRMNRNYTTKEFQEVVNIVRRGVEGINITTDIIVGFPGETKKDFNQTLEFIRKMKFGKLHVFRYSSRKGTQAYKKGEQWDKVNSKVKKKRSKEVRELGKKLKKDFWQSQIGKQAIAKIWGKGQGLTDNYIPIKVKKGEKFKEPKVKQVSFKKTFSDYVEAVCV